MQFGLENDGAQAQYREGNMSLTSLLIAASADGREHT